MRLLITALACLISLSTIGQDTNNFNLTADDYFNRGLRHLDIGHNQEAITDFTMAIRIDPDYAEAYYNRGNALLYLEEYNDVNQMVRDALADTGRVGHTWCSTCFNRVMKAEKNCQDAIDEYTRAVSIAPNYADAYFNRGIAYLYLGNYDDALADYTCTISIDPDYAASYRNRVDYEGVIAYYTSEIRIDPDYTEAYNNRGIAKYFAGFDGCSDLMKAEELGHAHPDALKAICE